MRRELTSGRDASVSPVVDEAGHLGFANEERLEHLSRAIDLASATLKVTKAPASSFDNFGDEEMLM